MTDLYISVEGISPELESAYAVSGMNRGKAGSTAIKWAFGGNNNAFAVARADGQIVGISSYIKSIMHFGKSVGTGFQAVDSYVNPGMRGRGLFTRLASTYTTHAADHGVDLIWGFPNDNAAPAWFGKLHWYKHGQVPMLIKPLRSGYLFRKLGLPWNFPLFLAKDQAAQQIHAFGSWADSLWDQFSRNIKCGTVRNSAYLTHRLIGAPQASEYCVVADTDPNQGAILATRAAEKHGGRIVYIMEAFGGKALSGLVNSELAKWRDQGYELALAWAYPWSPNYGTLRRCGFFQLPERLRPIRIWFGGSSLSDLGKTAAHRKNWYLSYLDSDTV